VWSRRTQRVCSRRTLRVWEGQEDEDSDGVGQEQHKDLEGLDQEHHGGFADDEGGEGDGPAAGSISTHHQFRRSHVVALL
jgi:hypothetical protein